MVIKKILSGRDRIFCITAARRSLNLHGDLSLIHSDHLGPYT